MNWITRSTEHLPQATKLSSRSLAFYVILNLHHAISTNPKPTIYRNLYDNTSPSKKPVQYKGYNGMIDIFMLTVTVGRLI